MKKQKFKVGDKVEWCGCEGFVDYIDKNLTCPLKVQLDNGFLVSFELDGRYHYWHLEPSLKLIERPKRTVKRTMWQGVLYNSVYDRYEACGSYYGTKQAAMAEAEASNFPGEIGAAPIEVEMLEEGDDE